MGQASRGSLQRDSSDEEDCKNNVREDSGEVNNFPRGGNTLQGEIRHYIYIVFLELIHSFQFMLGSNQILGVLFVPNQNSNQIDLDPLLLNWKKGFSYQVWDKQSSAIFNK